MSINLSRNTRLWVSTVLTGHTNANTFELPIQEGYSLGQAVSTSDVTVDEAGPAPIRGSKRFNDSMDPVDWSFSTYMLPYTSGSNVMLVDMLMWQGLAVAKGETADFTDALTPVHGTTTKFTVGFTKNSAHVLTPLHMYFLIDNQMYLIKDAQVGQAELSVDISDIGQVAWSGQAVSYEPIATPVFASAAGDIYDPASILTNTYVAIPSNKNYMVNKLTIMDLNADVAPTASDGYNVPITGASVTINNNVTYLTPSTLSEVDKPIGSFTGSFDVSGSIDAYLRASGGDGSLGNEYGSAELLQHMLAATNQVTNAANLVLHVGGKTPGEPGVTITLPNAMLSVPEFSVDDVVSSSMEFKGITSDANMASGDEIYLDFYVVR